MTTEVVIKRVYQHLKKQVISHEIRPGSRLVIGPLADDLLVSTTPVREALNRLLSEGLIDVVPQIGFFVRQMTEHDLRNLYDLNRLLLDWSLGVLRKGHLISGLVRPPRLFSEFSDASPDAPPSAEALVRVAGELFCHVALQSNNREIIGKVRNINDRLYYVRLQEPDVLPDGARELSALCRLYYRKDYSGLRDALQAYHDRRTAAVEDLLSLVLSCDRDAGMPEEGGALEQS